MFFTYYLKVVVIISLFFCIATTELSNEQININNICSFFIKITTTQHLTPKQIKTLERNKGVKRNEPKSNKANLDVSLTE